MLQSEPGLERILSSSGSLATLRRPRRPAARYGGRRALPGGVWRELPFSDTREKRKLPWPMPQTAPHSPRAARLPTSTYSARLEGFRIGNPSSPSPRDETRSPHRSRPSPLPECRRLTRSRANPEQCRLSPLAFLDHDGVTHGSILVAALPEGALQCARLQMGIW